jgi:hypothetical protein
MVPPKSKTEYAALWEKQIKEEKKTKEKDFERVNKRRKSM